MVRRQALGWLGAALCSVALVVAGGLVLSSVAVHRYLQASNSAMAGGTASESDATPDPSELASIERTVSAITSLPGVATATSTVGTDEPSATAEPTADRDASGSAPEGLSYDISVIMNPDASVDESTSVVYAMTEQLQNAHVNLELAMPASAARAASVIDYRHAFDTPVARSTVDSVCRAVAVAASVPGVRSVHVVVPYTWNLSSGDLEVEMATDDSQQASALRSALDRTALAGVDWSTSR